MKLMHFIILSIASNETSDMWQFNNLPDYFISSKPHWQVRLLLRLGTHFNIIQKLFFPASYVRQLISFFQWQVLRYWKIQREGTINLCVCVWERARGSGAGMRFTVPIRVQWIHHEDITCDRLHFVSYSNGSITVIRSKLGKYISDLCTRTHYSM